MLSASARFVDACNCMQLHRKCMQHECEQEDQECWVLSAVPHVGFFQVC